MFRIANMLKPLFMGEAYRLTGYGINWCFVEQYRSWNIDKNQMCSFNCE
jgi:hypothetical protein